MQDNIPEKEVIKVRDDFELTFSPQKNEQDQKELKKLLRILKIIRVVTWIKSQVNFSSAYYIGLMFLGGSALSILGLEYDSLHSLAKFISIFFLVTIPLDWIFDAFFDIIKESKDISDAKHKFLYMMTSIPLNMFIIGAIEAHLENVSCSIITAFLFCLVYEIVVDAIFANGCIYLRD